MEYVISEEHRFCGVTGTERMWQVTKTVSKEYVTQKGGIPNPERPK